MDVYVNPRRRLDFSVLSRISALVALLIDFSTFSKNRINYLPQIPRRKKIFTQKYVFQTKFMEKAEVGIEKYWKHLFGDKNNSNFTKIASRWSNLRILLPWWWNFHFSRTFSNFDLFSRYFWSFLQVPLIMPARYSPPLCYLSRFSCTALEKNKFSRNWIANSKDVSWSVSWTKLNQTLKKAREINPRSLMLVYD